MFYINFGLLKSKTGSTDEQYLTMCTMTRSFLILLKSMGPSGKIFEMLVKGQCTTAYAS